MSYVLVRHSVQDYAEWKPVFDGVIDTRRAGGERAYQIYHTGDDPNDLVLLFEWDSPANARQYFQSSELCGAMQRAGVVGAPNIVYLEEVEKRSL